MNWTPTIWVQKKCPLPFTKLWKAQVVVSLPDKLSWRDRINSSSLEWSDFHSHSLQWPCLLSLFSLGCRWYLIVFSLFLPLGPWGYICFVIAFFRRHICIKYLFANEIFVCCLFQLTSDIIFRCNTAAIATVVTIAEILKNNGLAVEKSESLPFHFLILQVREKLFCFFVSFLLLCWVNLNENFLELPCAEITTSTVDMKDESRGRPVQKAKVSLKCKMVW